MGCLGAKQSLVSLTTFSKAEVDEPVQVVGVLSKTFSKSHIEMSESRKSVDGDLNSVRMVSEDDLDLTSIVDSDS